MSFAEYEVSEEGGAPFELYEFQYGDSAAYRYTNYDHDVEWNGVVWLARPISRESYRSSGKVDKTTLDIKMPVDSDIAALFTGFPPTQVVRAVVRAGHRADPENPLVIWTGRVLSVAKQDNQITLTCDSTLVSMKRVGLRRNWQLACPFQLYGPQCKAETEPRQATVTAVGQGSVQLTGNWAEGVEPHKFNGGMMRWQGNTGTEYRTIHNVTENSLNIVGPLRGLSVGETVDIFLGCNRRTDDCQNLHNNIHNFGGMPWIPTKNPVRYHPFW
ncbi:phage BR0599 family protein [Amorphus orientalis]|uniref:Phage protein (TIGR02218 family) n=1 Tax=Amorphus orientalis TaxID=649198 RepID=A0AAE4AV03_9HYPH|nr:phage BR0599 family protein [Amorphus orientalis]MDQ0317727.1 putative phage protein (TIGR02218 family) [Amorphus orientalis]